MANQLVQKSWNEVSILSQDFDNTTRNLINWQMQVIAGMDDISLMPDVITLAINAIDTLSDSSNFNNLASNLANFIYGSVFIAKAKYRAVVEKNKLSAIELLKSAATTIINNI